MSVDSAWVIHCSRHMLSITSPCAATLLPRYRACGHVMTIVIAVSSAIAESNACPLCIG